MAEIASILGIGASLAGGLLGGGANRRRQREAEAEARRQQQILMDEQARRNFASQIFQQDTEGLSMGGRDRARADLSRTFGRSLIGANQLSAAALGGLGNNSLLANQVSGNARRSAQLETTAANALDQQYLGQRLGIRGQFAQDQTARDFQNLGQLANWGNNITGIVGQRQFSGDTWGPIASSMGGTLMGAGMGGMFGSVGGSAPQEPGSLFRSTAVDPRAEGGYPSPRSSGYR